MKITKSKSIMTVTLGIAAAGAIALGGPGTANAVVCAPGEVVVGNGCAPALPSFNSTGPGNDKPDTAVAPGEWKLEDRRGNERWYNGTRDEAQAKADAGYAGRKDYTSRGNVPKSDGNPDDVK